MGTRLSDSAEQWKAVRFGLVNLQATLQPLIGLITPYIMAVPSAWLTYSHLEKELGTPWYVSAFGFLAVELVMQAVIGSTLDAVNEYMKTAHTNQVARQRKMILIVTVILAILSSLVLAAINIAPEVWADKPAANQGVRIAMVVALVFLSLISASITGTNSVAANMKLNAIKPKEPKIPALEKDEEPELPSTHKFWDGNVWLIQTKEDFLELMKSTLEPKPTAGQLVKQGVAGKSTIYAWFKELNQ